MTAHWVTVPLFFAQVVGTTTIVGVTVVEARQVAMGWSVKRVFWGVTFTTIVA